MSLAERRPLTTCHTKKSRAEPYQMPNQMIEISAQLEPHEFPDTSERQHGYYSWSSTYGYHRYSPLLSNRDTSRRHVNLKTTCKSTAIVAIIFVLSWTTVRVLPRLAGLVAESSTLRSAPNGLRNRTEDKSVFVRVHNSYSSEGRIDLYPWEHVAEPYRKTTLQMVSWSSESSKEDVVFRWQVSNVEIGTGTSVDHTFKSPGAYECLVAVVLTSPTNTTNSEEVAAEQSFTVTVKYVRREIRSLTDRDRETFFNAVSVLQRVPSTVGQEVYGKKFYSKDYFNRMHLYYGGRTDCDHWHAGAGFVTSHIAISLMFEQSLQAVDPSIALPYWDFTIEGTEYDWTNFRSSIVFSDDWFGAASPRNMLGTPNRGRFAYVPTMADAREYSELYNAYGLLRSPWNTDPNPVLTRHDHIFGYPNNRKPSGCKQYKDAMLKTSWMDLTISMNLGAHGHIHEIIGGTWSADWHGFKERTAERVFPFMHNIVPYMKFLWRSGFLECPESCARDVPWRDCHCACANLEAVSKTPSQVLEEAGLLERSVGLFFYDKDMKLIDNLGTRKDRAFTVIPGYSKEETADIYSELLSVLCTPMKIGTHYEGTSTNDVTFWVLHPTFDRIWHLQRLENDSPFDETWLDDHPCYGHNPSDVQPFFNLFDKLEETDQGVQVPKKYQTNIELYDLLRPDGIAIPYTYDNFEWPHCDARGIYIRGRGEDEEK